MAPRPRPRRLAEEEDEEEEEDPNDIDAQEREDAEAAENEQLLDGNPADGPRAQRQQGPRLAGKTAAEKRQIRAQRAEAKRQRERARYDALTPAERKKRNDRAYAVAHAGEAPRHKTQPRAAARHDLDVPPHAPLTILRRNVTGNASARPVGVEPNVPPAADPNEPLSFTNLMAVITRWKSGEADASARNNWIQTMRQIMERHTGLGPTAVVKLADVGMWFRPVDEVIAKVKDFRLLVTSRRLGKVFKKGDPISPYSLVKFLNAYMIVAQRWAALRLTPAELAEYKDAFNDAKRAAKAEQEARAPVLPMRFEDMAACVLKKFGELSLPNIYMTVYEYCPARDDFGSLQVVQQRKDASDVLMNYLILSDGNSKDASGRNRMAVLLNHYKTSQKDGPRTFPLPAGVRDLVNRYLNRERDPLYLFPRPGTGGREPAARLQTEEERLQGKPAPGMSAIVGKFLHDALPRRYHYVLDRAAITSLRKSWATSTKLPMARAADMMMHSVATHEAAYFSKEGTARPITWNDHGSDASASSSEGEEGEEGESEEEEEEEEEAPRPAPRARRRMQNPFPPSEESEGEYDAEADRAAGALNANSTAAQREARRRGKAVAAGPSRAAPPPPPPLRASTRVRRPVRRG